MSSRKFLYFAYGSNLLRERLKLHNPTAAYQCVARLDDHYFHFCGFGKRWQGAMGAIHEKPGSHVWGVVWELDESDREHLDHQEKYYTPIQVDVINTDNEILHCRTYLLADTETRPPSPHYKEIILLGARQNKLPEDYIKFLESFPDNGYKGQVKVYEKVMVQLQQSQENPDKI